MAKWLEKILSNIPNHNDDIDTSGLTKLQAQALTAMAQGKNVFLTGGAGTGKSHVLKRFLKLREKGHFIVACAPTGIAALNLEWGVTVHKAFSVPVGEIADYRRITEAAFGPKSYVKRADTIVIDEISMCPIDVFDYAMAWLHEIEEERGREFQIIVCGDFFQLPPVMSDGKIELLRNVYEDIESGFCFESHYWPELNFETYNLTEVIRQKDPELIEMLNRARIGDTSCLDYFNNMVIDEFYEPGDDVVLSGRNNAVDKINNERLGLIDSEAQTYNMQVYGDVPLSRVNFVDTLTLKVGARVMAITNDNAEYAYVNGSIGTVTSLHDDHVSVRWDNGEKSDIYAEEIEVKEPSYRNGEFTASIKGSYVQIPLKLCYAITIHKSQGQSIDRCVIFPNSFEKGQLYVAMSRCTNAEHLHFATPIKESDLRVSQAVIDFYDSL
ncbi:MAG: AAA family ATPase [Candidatus Saccharibacteria bacterium]|nr:AAA family ATPase [Candidatus Saccharibacteria bacterium]